MIFKESPQPLRRKRYERAAKRYVELVGARAAAVYRVGNLRRPGLSDLDLIVVPRGAHWDNSWYFSARHRLPAHLAIVFRHEPRILPAAALDAIRFTTHSNRKLIHGRDVIGGREAFDTAEQDWSILLEGYLRFHHYYYRTLDRGRASIRYLISTVTNLVYSLRILDSRIGTELAGQLEKEMEALRANFFESQEPPEVHAARAWELFRAGFEAFRDELVRTLPLKPSHEPQHFARNFLIYGRQLPGLDPERLAERRRMIREYHDALGRIYYFRGGLFFRVAYEDQQAEALRRYEPPAWARRFIERRYGFSVTGI